MPGKNPNRQPRLGSLKHTAPGWIRMARCQACGHQATLLVAALLKRWGELHLVEFAMNSLRCSACDQQDVAQVLVRLCDPGCPRQRG